MTENKDISIGDGQWIKWREIDGANSNRYNVDTLLDGTAMLWKNLETECVAECCGIEAFALWPADIKKAAQNLDSAVLKDCFIQLISKVEQNENTIVVSRKLNNLFDKQVFIQMIKHIIGCL
ncbi:DUF6331 family protein [Flavitalea antarctica]